MADERPDWRSRSILNVVRLMGYQVKVLHEPSFTELHATPVKGGPEYVARSGAEERLDREYRAAVELARMLKLNADEL